MFCHVASEQVFGVHDVTFVYHVPLLVQSQNIVEFLRKRLKLEKVNITKEMEDKGKSLGKRWKDITIGYVSSPRCCELRSDTYFRQERLFDTVTIALVGKYTDLKDSYMSVTRALEHSAFRVQRKAVSRRPHLQRKPHQH